MRKQWFETKQQQGIPVWLAEEEGVVLGFGTYGPFRAWAAYQYSVENSVYVASHARGKGIGSLLLPAIISEARQQGMHTMIAGIDASNDASIRLHRKFGFEQVALFREVGWKFDRWLDLAFLQLML
jgi:phosphinothricin acetyltransferase